jgi:hypothetical protein
MRVTRFVVGAGVAGILVAALAFLTPPPVLSAQRAGTPAASAPAMPQYDATRNLRLPEGYRQWILVGSSLGLSYAPAGQSGRQSFNTTLMEPSAYQHYLQTGEFREGTMLALVVQGVGSNQQPAREGQFASDIRGVEFAVKDKGRVPEGWAYYAFGSPANGLKTSAAPNPKTSCYDCHAEHAAKDNVFMQFYGLLQNDRH